jgi:predicted MFS family arabinose efflux permease
VSSTASLAGTSEAVDRRDLRLLTALGASIVLGTFGYVLLGPFFPEIAADLNTTVPLLGQISAARLLLGAALGLLAGPLADGFGHRRVMAVGLVAAGLTMVGVGLAPTYPAMAATAVPGAVAGATLTGLSLAVAGSVFAGAARRRALGWVVGAQAISSIIGVPVLVAVGGVAGWRTVFLLAGMAALATTPFIVRALPSPSAGQASAGRRMIRLSTIAGAYVPLLRHRPALRLFAVTGLRAITWGGLVTYFGAFLKEGPQLSDGWVGVAFLLAGATFLIGSVAAGGRLAFLPPRALAAAGDGLTALLIGVFFAAPLPDWAAVAAATLAAFTGAFAYVGVTTLLAVAAPAGAGTTMTLNGSLFGLGSAGGGAIGGVLIAVGGYEALGVGLPAFMLVAAWLVLRPDRAPHAVDLPGELVDSGPTPDPVR